MFSRVSNTGRGCSWRLPFPPSLTPDHSSDLTPPSPHPQCPPQTHETASRPSRAANPSSPQRTGPAGAGGGGASVSTSPLCSSWSRAPSLLTRLTRLVPEQLGSHLPQETPRRPTASAGACRTYRMEMRLVVCLPPTGRHAPGDVAVLLNGPGTLFHLGSKNVQLHVIYRAELKDSP